MGHDACRPTSDLMLVTGGAGRLSRTNFPSRRVSAPEGRHASCPAGQFNGRWFPSISDKADYPAVDRDRGEQISVGEIPAGRSTGSSAGIPGSRRWQPQVLYVNNGSIPAVAATAALPPVWVENRHLTLRTRTSAPAHNSPEAVSPVSANSGRGANVRSCTIDARRRTVGSPPKAAGAVSTGVSSRIRAFAPFQTDPLPPSPARGAGEVIVTVWPR
jgi:hypothetical protein